MMGFLKSALGLSEQASWMHTHLVSFVELSYIYSSSASVAWQSLLLALTSIDGHLHSPLISCVNVRLSPILCSPHNPHHHILFHRFSKIRDRSNYTFLLISALIEQTSKKS